VYRARRAVIEGIDPPAGTVVPDVLIQGWQGERPVSAHTLRRAFADQFTPAEVALWRSGENARRRGGSTTGLVVHGREADPQTSSAVSTISRSLATCSS
jgi:hypothetical protein